MHLAVCRLHGWLCSEDVFILDVFVVGEWRLSLANAEQHIQVNMRIRSEVLKVLHAEDRRVASRGIYFANFCFESAEKSRSWGTPSYSSFHIIRKQPVALIYQILLSRQNWTAIPDTLLEDVHVFLHASRVCCAKWLSERNMFGTETVEKNETYVLCHILSPQGLWP
jgi:hypothetical protein